MFLQQMNGLLIFGSIVFTFFEGKQYRIDLIDSLFSFILNKGFTKTKESHVKKKEFKNR